MTMLVGYLWGKRYSKGQALGVVMLTVGVIIAAMADAQSKGKMSQTSPTIRSYSATSFINGLAILFVAQLLSAIMGLYVQSTYATYGPHWRENLFYSHLLSLPLFIPFWPSIRAQFSRLLASPPLMLRLNPSNSPSLTSAMPPSSVSWSEQLFGFLTSSKAHVLAPLTSTQVPTHLVTLLLNSLTQFACIRGVNLLGARTTALGVTIMLNLRKLVSLFASIWLFENQLPLGVIAGATVVFAGAGVYAWASGQLKGSGKLK